MLDGKYFQLGLRCVGTPVCVHVMNACEGQCPFQVSSQTESITEPAAHCEAQEASGILLFFTSPVLGLQLSYNTPGFSFDPGDLN